MQYINRIQFGFGARQELPEELSRLGVSRPFVISDRGVAAAGVLAKAVQYLSPDTPTFLDVPPNPTEDAVLRAVATFDELGCDSIIAVGGGSPIDCAKAVALLKTHRGPLEQYLARTGGSDLIVRPLTPIVAVPTTAGTGSEVGRGAGISLSNGEKGVFLSPFLVPTAAICDPALTVDLPPHLTAGTGIDAFTHAVEAFLSPAVNPPADAIALDAAQRLIRFLPRAVLDGSDREARWEVMMGAVEAAMTTWKGLGAAHALSNPFEDLGLHHGTSVGVVLPATLDYILPVIDSERKARLGAALGCDSNEIADRVRQLNRSIGLPHGLSEMGVERTQLADMATLAAASAFNLSAPRNGSPAEYLLMAKASY